MPITAQELDRRITIQRFTTTTNEFNDPVEAWATFISVWARRRDGSDVVKTEILGAEQVGAYLLTHFTIRSSAQAKTVTPADQINYDGHIWNIKGTKEAADGRNRFIEITAVRANN
jgi:SPP1 family predicted phage head-tail adaptor